MTKNKNKVILGFSGGVDSTVAAFLLKKQGFEVIGFYFNVTDRHEEESIAIEVATQLGIELITKNVKEDFDNVVVRDFCRQYLMGRTPNPCVICNPTIKFSELLNVANEHGAYYIATGHYAKVVYDENDDVFFVHKGANERKDQSYMLYRLNQDVLSRLLLPLGEFEDKEEVREVAKLCGTSNAEKKDSQELCFIDETVESHTEFMKRNGYVSPPGDFLDIEGNIIGEHKGLIHYTIGQRKGLGIALGKPAFVVRIDAENNTIMLGDEEILYTDIVYATDCFFSLCKDEKKLNGILPSKYENEKIEAKVRYSSKTATGVIYSDELSELVMKFDSPQRAITPGQSIVIYMGDRVIGGGIINNVLA